MVSTGAVVSSSTQFLNLTTDIFQTLIFSSQLNYGYAAVMLQFFCVFLFGGLINHWTNSKTILLRHQNEEKYVQAIDLVCFEKYRDGVFFRHQNPVQF